jgi:hypothetical protein
MLPERDVNSSIKLVTVSGPKTREVRGLTGGSKKQRLLYQIGCRSRSDVAEYV